MARLNRKKSRLDYQSQSDMPNWYYDDGGVNTKKKKINLKITKSKYSPDKKNTDKNVTKKVTKHVIKQQIKKAGPLLGLPKKLVKRVGGPVGIVTIGSDAWKLLQRQDDSGTTYHNRDLNYMQKGKYDIQGLSDSQKRENLAKDRKLIEKRSFQVRPKRDISGNIINRNQGDVGYLQQGLIMKEGGITRDYKKEYKKFQSSGVMKKYRAKLNKYNRKKGTYGNGDGLDATHKGGAIVGFEASSKNKGRAEKSRLKGSTRKPLFPIDEGDKGMFIKYGAGGGVYGSLFYEKSGPPKKEEVDKTLKDRENPIVSEFEDPNKSKCPEGQTWNEETKKCEVSTTDSDKTDEIIDDKVNEKPVEKIYSQHDKDYDYKVVDGQWQFTKKGGKDWKNINKGGADVLNKTYPDALKKKKKKVIPEGRRGMIIKKRKRGVQFKKKDCGCKH